MTDSRPVRFGILGAGRIATERFAPALRTLPDAVLTAVASRDVKRAQNLQPQRTHDSYAALLDSPDIDAVYIATHNGLHRDQALHALRAGKHVLCEKPLGRDARECAEIADAAREHGRHLVEAFMYRHHPQIAAVRQLVEQGAIGDLRVVEAAFSFHLTKRDDVRLRPDWGGGALLDVGCYCVNVCRMFLGDEPSEVQSTAHFDPEHGVDLSLHGTLAYGDGRFGVISCGFDSGLRQHVVLSGTAGTISLDRPFVSWIGTPTVTIDGGAKSETRTFDPVDVFALEIADFVGAVRTDRAPLLAPDEGLRNARILDALAAAAR